MPCNTNLYVDTVEVHLKTAVWIDDSSDLNRSGHKTNFELKRTCLIDTTVSNVKIENDDVYIQHTVGTLTKTMMIPLANIKALNKWSEIIHTKTPPEKLA